MNGHKAKVKGIPLVTVEQMRQLEDEANQRGHTYERMMQQAGRGLAQQLEMLFSSETTYPEMPWGLLALVGKGNNGGDTLVALHQLLQDVSYYPWRFYVYLVPDRPPEDPLLRVLEAHKDVSIMRASEDPNLETLRLWLTQEEIRVVLDGILGTGFRLPLREDVAAVLNVVRETLQHRDPRPMVVAVDVPSGLDCNTGEAAAETLHADVTVTMAAVKMGMVQGQGPEYVGQALYVVDIGLPEDLPTWKQIHREVPDLRRVQAILPPRPRTAHKGTFGTVLVVGGSLRYTGAVYLAGKAAYRVGAGLVTLAVPEPLHPALAGVFPEATWWLLPHEQGFLAREAAAQVHDLLREGRVRALVLGPGLGRTPATRAFIDALLPPPEGEAADFPWPPMVVDADALKILAELPEWPKRLPGPAVLTPHPGEMAALTGEDKDAIQRERVYMAEGFAKKWGHVVVLKGACTVIASPDDRTGVLAVATPALARAGTGDVLAGAIAGLMAQGVRDPYEAALAAAWLHGEAGRMLEERGSTASVLAGDILDGLRDVFIELGI